MSGITVNKFHDLIKEQFTFLKHTENLQNALQKGLKLSQNNGYLVPVCRAHVSDLEISMLMTQWRNQNIMTFPSRFEATLERTRNWLIQHLLNVDDRLLFLVFNANHEIVGHLGYANCFSQLSKGRKVMEIDNVVRGKKGNQPGIMGQSLHALLNWAQKTFSPDEIFLRVLQDNSHAIRFYLNNAFVEERRIPLWLSASNEEEHLKSEPVMHRAPDNFFVKMIYVGGKNRAHRE